MSSHEAATNSNMAVNGRKLTNVNQRDLSWAL